METMIERVAAAIHCCADDASAEDMAKAAIAAMREPTENMLDFGACHEDQDHNIFDEGHISREVWQAMIDAALSEQP